MGYADGKDNDAGGKSKGSKPAKLDEMLTKLVGWYDGSETASETARGKQSQDRNYYDGRQWTDAEIAELNRRGQPVVTINRISGKVNFIRGTEVRTRVDPWALPRTPAHEDAAIAATDALRYVCDREEFDRIRSKVTDNLLVEGYGGAIVEIETVKSREKGAADRVEIRLRHVPWDRLFFDPHSREECFADAKYVGIISWMDLDDAMDLYPDSEETLENAVAGDFMGSDDSEDKPTEWADSKRKRVKVCEIYWHKGKEWHVAHFTKSGFLVEPKPTHMIDEDGHHECPLKITSAYVAGDDLERYGVVRHMISLQDEINKRRSKALHLMSVRRIIADRGAVEDVQKARVESGKADGYIELNIPGARFEVQQSGEMAASQFSLLQESKAEIDQVGPSLPQATGSASASGRAIIARQQAGGAELEPVFDHLRQWQREVFRLIWNRIRQFWTEERWIRVRDDADRKGFRFVAMNREMTKGERVKEMVEKDVPPAKALESVGVKDGAGTLEKAMQQVMQQAQQQLGPEQAQQIPPEEMQKQALEFIYTSPEAEEKITDNDMAALDVDIILEETPDTSVIEQEEFERLTAMVQAGVQIPPDILIEASQLRNKRKLLDMMREGPDPQQQQLQQQVQSIGIAQAEADVAKTQAQTDKEQSTAMLNAAKAGSETGGADAAPRRVWPRARSS